VDVACHGLPYSGSATMPKPIQPRLSIEEMAELYRAGHSLYGIGLRAGMGAAVIGQLLREAGVEIRKRGWRTKEAGAGGTYQAHGWH
jgi:hypothetical protein